MRRPIAALLLFLAGCRHPDGMPQTVERQIAAVAPVRLPADLVPCAAEVPPPQGPLNLPVLWEMALANNPSLREAAAEVEAARGRYVQAGKYPNPRLVFNEEEFGGISATGNVSLQVMQEILTAGKRRRSLAVGERGVDVATVALLGRKFDVLTRIRRGWYDVLTLAAIVRVNEEVVHSLEESLDIVRQLVEKAGSRPRTDLIRLQAVLDQARIALARARTNVEAAWRQLAAEVGVPSLPLPSPIPPLPGGPPSWDGSDVSRRVQAANSELRQAMLEADMARLEWERARAEAVPNVHLGGGWVRSNIDETSGAIVSVETALPTWDRKQGQIREARARWERARAAAGTVSTRLSRETAEAFGRYEGTRIQIERLVGAVLPRLEESLKLVQDGYQKGVPGVTFADVQLALEALNDARLRLAEARRELWRAVADLEGLMQLDLGEEVTCSG
jgi:cobalt-zinc-cadmium efflux system outer membrane protein